MSQDVVSDVLNRIMNAKRAGKKELVVRNYSKVLLKILTIAKESDYLDYSLNNKELKIEIKHINSVEAIKPRFTVSVKRINFYVRRFLPAKDFGFLVVSTNKGLMRHDEAEKQKLGGCLVAYMY